MTTTIMIDDFNAFMHLQDKFASKEENHWYLQGVHIQQHPEGILCAATDGRVMGIYKNIVSIEGDPLPPEGVIIKVSAKVGRSKLSPTIAQFVLPEKDKYALLMGACHNLKPGVVRRIEGTYPDYRRCIPDGKMAVGVHGAIDPGLLSAFKPPYRIEKNPGVYVLCAEGKDEAYPLLVLNRDDRFTGVLMGMRVLENLNTRLETAIKATQPQKKE